MPAVIPVLGSPAGSPVFWPRGTPSTDDCVGPSRPPALLCSDASAAGLEFAVFAVPLLRSLSARRWSFRMGCVYSCSTVSFTFRLRPATCRALSLCGLVLVLPRCLTCLTSVGRVMALWSRLPRLLLHGTFTLFRISFRRDLSSISLRLAYAGTDYFVAPALCAAGIRCVFCLLGR